MISSTMIKLIAVYRTSDLFFLIKISNPKVKIKAIKNGKTQYNKTLFALVSKPNRPVLFGKPAKTKTYVKITNNIVINDIFKIFIVSIFLLVFHSRY